MVFKSWNLEYGGLAPRGTKNHKLSPTDKLYASLWSRLSMLSDQHTQKIGTSYKLLAALINKLQGENEARDHQDG